MVMRERRQPCGVLPFSLSQTIIWLQLGMVGDAKIPEYFQDSRGCLAAYTSLNGLLWTCVALGTRLNGVHDLVLRVPFSLFTPSGFLCIVTLKPNSKAVMEWLCRFNSGQKTKRTFDLQHR